MHAIWTTILHPQLYFYLWITDPTRSDHLFAPRSARRLAPIYPIRSPPHPCRIHDPPAPIHSGSEQSDPIRSLSDPPHTRSARSDPTRPIRPIRSARSDVLDPIRPIRCATRCQTTDEASVPLLVERCRGKCAADPPGPAAVRRAATVLVFGRGQPRLTGRDRRGGGATASHSRWLNGA